MNNVKDANASTNLLACTTLRNVLGTKSLSEILTDREVIADAVLEHLDKCTDPWGVKVCSLTVRCTLNKVQDIYHQRCIEWR